MKLIIFNAVFSVLCVANGLHEAMFAAERWRIILGCFNLLCAYWNIENFFDSLDRWKKRYQREQPFWQFEMLFFGPRSPVVAPPLVLELKSAPYISMVMGFIPGRRKYSLRGTP